MLKSIILPLSIAMSLLCLTQGTAVAQVEPPGYVSVMRQPGVPPEFPPILMRTFVPVDVQAIDGPRRLAPGESGLFSTRANVESASLPIRSRWDFGDGHTASGLSARHQFAQPGTYAVTFRIWNEQSTDADTLVVTVGEQGAQHLVGALTNAEASYQRGTRMQK
jgi:hypothetical protein